MMKKYILFIACFICLKTHAQEMIGKSRAEVLEFAKQLGGNKIFDGEEQGKDGEKPFNAIRYMGSGAIKPVVYIMSFALRNDSCFTYKIAYSGDNIKQVFIDKFNKEPYEKQPGTLIWTDKQRGIQIEIGDNPAFKRTSDVVLVAFRKVDKS